MPYRDPLAAAQARIQSLEAQLETLQAGGDSAIEARMNLENRMVDLQAELAESRAHQEALQEALQESLDATQEELEAAIQQIEELQAKRDGSEIQRFEAEMKAARLHAAELAGLRAQHREELTMLNQRHQGELATLEMDLEARHQEELARLR